MSGLESIALAVAHLEEMSRANGQEAKTVSSSDGQGPSNEPSLTPSTSAHMPALVRASPSPTMMMQHQMIARPSPFVLPPGTVHHHQAARAVSSDSISSTFQNHQEAEDDHHRDVASCEASAEVTVRMRESSKAMKVKQPTYAGPAPQHPVGSIKNNDHVAISASRHVSVNNHNSLDSILADPQTWLEATQAKPIPEGAAGVFEKVEQDDVLCGRGGESNHHAGNQQYRKLVKAFQPLYIASKRRYKPRIAQCIVFTIRSYGGRFLKRTGPHNNAFEDVGNTKAREKTSQALREGAPDLRGCHPGGLMESEEYGSATTHSAPKRDSPTTTNLAAAPSAVVMPPNASTFLNHQHFLRAQLGPFSFHPSFAASLTPLQQALLMANHHSAAVASAALPSTPPTAAAPAVLPHQSLSSPVAPAAVSGQKTKKRSAAMAGGGSCEEMSTGSSNTSSTTSATEEKTGASTKARAGPRVKRLKHRVLTKEKNCNGFENASAEQ